MAAERIFEAAGTIPPEWYGGEWDELEKLVHTLLHRQRKVRGLIEEFRKSSRQPFPNWRAN